MARRISPSQLKNELRQIQNQQKQAIDRYNQAVRRYNQGVKRAVDDYNRKAREHNARVRSNRNKLKSELAKFQQRSSSSCFVTYQVSARTLHTAYLELNAHAKDPAFHLQPQLVDLSEQETANNFAVVNALMADNDEIGEESEEPLKETLITDELAKLSPDLDNRWRGALYSLNPRNPDAARHFCTSAREIFTHKQLNKSFCEILRAK